MPTNASADARGPSARGPASPDMHTRRPVHARIAHAPPAILPPADMHADIHAVHMPAAGFETHAYIVSRQQAWDPYTVHVPQGKFGSRTTGQRSKSAAPVTKIRPRPAASLSKTTSGQPRALHQARCGNHILPCEQTHRARTWTVGGFWPGAVAATGEPLPQARARNRSRPTLGPPAPILNPRAPPRHRRRAHGPATSRHGPRPGLRPASRASLVGRVRGRRGRSGRGALKGSARGWGAGRCKSFGNLAKSPDPIHGNRL